MKPLMLVAGGFIAGIFLMIAVDHQPWLLASLKYNFSWDTGWSWVGALSGWVAAAVALPTVFYLKQQVGQVRQASLDQARGVSDTLVIDLVATANQLPKIKYLHDLEPGLSNLARSMIRDATAVAPVLAVALQRHCQEVGAFEAVIRARTPLGAAIVGELLKDTQKLAFRAVVLSWCFGVASAKIKKTGKAKGPYIDRSDLKTFEDAYNVGEDEWGFLNDIFKHGGIDEK